MSEDVQPNQAMPSKATPDKGPTLNSQATGSQSGEKVPAGQETANDPMRDPSAAGADAYNSGNKTGNPVKSGMPATGETGPGVNAEKPVPMREKK